MTGGKVLPPPRPPHPPPPPLCGGPGRPASPLLPRMCVLIDDCFEGPEGYNPIAQQGRLREITRYHQGGRFVMVRRFSLLLSVLALPAGAKAGVIDLQEFFVIQGEYDKCGEEVKQGLGPTSGREDEFKANQDFVNLKVL